MNERPCRALRCVAALAAACLVACASSVPQRASEWIDPTLGANSGILRSGKVLVACESWDLSMRQNCQAALSQQLQNRGATPVVPDAVPAASDRELDSQLRALAATVGARSVMVVALTPTVTGSSFSGASIGIGGFSWGGSGGAGIGLSAPIGGTGWGSTSVAAQARITDVPTGRLMWSTTFVGSSSTNFTTQIRDLAGAISNAAQGAGLL